MKRVTDPRTIIAVSGGPDSVYLVHRIVRAGGTPCIAHLNHGVRGNESDADQEFVERLAASLALPVEVERVRLTRGGMSGLEDLGRKARYRFFRGVKNDRGAGRILVAHTADDQVETVLMRILEGAGISGLKGIPRRTDDGLERPLLDTWREDIVEYLRRRKIAYRTDKSNADTRFERNWIRHVLLPLLEKRYGKAVRKRIFTLGERFREIDEFLDATVRRWMKRNLKSGPDAAGRSYRLPRSGYAKLPPVVRKKIVQILCFEKLDIAPNERLIEAVDKIILSGKPSARLDLGKGGRLSCRYAEAFFLFREPEDAPGAHGAAVQKLVVREMAGKPALARLRRLAKGEREAAFDADGISGPLAVRPLRAGDRIRPFGAAGETKVKEVLIDRKIPRDERWGRPVVCDAKGGIVWIPGVVRSSVAPVTPGTRRAIVLGISWTRDDMKGCSGAPRVLR